MFGAVRGIGLTAADLQRAMMNLSGMTGRLQQPVSLDIMLHFVPNELDGLAPSLFFDDLGKAGADTMPWC